MTFVPPPFEFKSLIYDSPKVYTKTTATLTFVPSYAVIANSKVLLKVPDPLMFSNGQVPCGGVSNIATGIN
jgi:hypothetical protein